MERAWELIQKAGGVLLLAEILIWAIGSAHVERPIRNAHQFAAAVDYVTERIERWAEER
jgi:hypothetical protein